MQSVSEETFKMVDDLKKSNESSWNKMVYDESGISIEVVLTYKVRLVRLKPSRT